MIFALSLERRDEFRYRCLNSIRGDRDDHEERHHRIEVSIIHRKKQSHHNEMVKKTEQIKNTDSNKHHTGVSNKLIFKFQKSQPITSQRESYVMLIIFIRPL